MLVDCAERCDNQSMSSCNTGKGQPHIKKKRISKACFWCNKRKVKCDGNLPCRTCLRTNAECFYAASKYKRRSETSVDSSVDPKVVTAPLETTAVHSGVLGSNYGNWTSSPVSLSPETDGLPISNSAVNANWASVSLSNLLGSPEELYEGELNDIDFFQFEKASSMMKVCERTPPVMENFKATIDLEMGHQLNANEGNVSDGSDRGLPLQESLSSQQLDRFKQIDSGISGEFRMLIDAMRILRPSWMCKPDVSLANYSPSFKELGGLEKQILPRNSRYDFDHAVNFDELLLNSELNEYLKDAELEKVYLPGNPPVKYIRKLLVMAGYSLLRTIIPIPIINHRLLLKNFAKAPRFLQYTVLLASANVYHNSFLCKTRTLVTDLKLRKEYQTEQRFGEEYFFELVNANFLRGVNEGSKFSVLALIIIICRFRNSTKNNLSSIAQSIIGPIISPIASDLQLDSQTEKSICPVFGCQEGKIIRALYWSYFCINQLLLCRSDMDSYPAVIAYPIKFPDACFHEIESKQTDSFICSEPDIMDLPSAKECLLELQASTLNHKNISVSLLSKILDRNPGILYKHVLTRIEEARPDLDPETKQNIMAYYAVTGAGSLQPAIPGTSDLAVQSLLLLSVCIRLVRSFRRFSKVDFNRVKTRKDFIIRVLNVDVFDDLADEFKALRHKMEQDQVGKDSKAVFARHFLDFCAILRVYVVNLRVSCIEWYKNYIASKPAKLKSSGTARWESDEYIDRLRLESLYFSLSIGVRSLRKTVSQSIDVMAKQLFCSSDVLSQPSTVNLGAESSNFSQDNLMEYIQSCILHVGFNPEPASVRAAVAFTDLLLREMRVVGLLLGPVQPLTMVSVTSIHASRLMRVFVKLENLCSSVKRAKSDGTLHTVLPTLKRHAEHLYELRRTILFYIDIMRLALMIVRHSISVASHMFKFVDRMLKFVLEIEKGARSSSPFEWNMLLADYAPLPGTPRIEKLSQIRDGSSIGEETDFKGYEKHMEEPSPNYYFHDSELFDGPIELSYSIPSQLIQALKKLFSEMGIHADSDIYRFNEGNPPETDAHPINSQTNERVASDPEAVFVDPSPSGPTIFSFGEMASNQNFCSLLNSCNLGDLDLVTQEEDLFLAPPQSSFMGKLDWNHKGPLNFANQHKGVPNGEPSIWQEEQFAHLINSEHFNSEIDSFGF